MHKLNKFLLVAFLMLIIGWAPASAQTILFDADGALGPHPFKPIDSLDWGVGNAIAVGVTASSPVGTTFPLFFQANLDTAKLSDGTIQYVNNTGRPFSQDSLTLVLGFQEIISSATFDPFTNTGSLKFAFTPGGANFFQIYANHVPGNNLSGACFVCGRLVMSGSILSDGFVSNLSALTTGSPGALDQAGGTDSYPGVSSIAGTGSFTLTGAVTFYDTDYFNGLASSTIVFAFANANTSLPFLQADPSACFFATTSSGGLNPTCSGTGGQTGVTPFLGVGQVDPLNGVSGPNMMFQTDGNSSLRTGQVP